jgi:hypothetical protein
MRRRPRSNVLAWGLGVALWLVTTILAGKPDKPKQKPLAPSPRRAQPARRAPTVVAVTVVELAGRQAYLRPGAGAGIRRSAKVVINRKEYAVVQTTDTYSMIEVGENPPHEQDKGQVLVVGEEDDKTVELPKPRPLSTWVHAWPEAEAPANSQSPRFVPLGGGALRDRRFDVRLSAAAGALLPIGQRGTSITRTELNARIHAEPFESVAFDLDLSLQRWFAADLDARAGSHARSAVYVRELLARYANGGIYGGIGRMRYAASTLGTLDGARVRATVADGLSIGAFGGLLPDPVNGAPSLDAQRFGVETIYSRPDTNLRPEAALVLHGSTFEGKLDERRISGVVALYPGLARFGGHFEVSQFDTQNRWNAHAIELTAAGLDASVRVGLFQLGGRFDVRQPERSRWLASFLPASWFCRTVPLPAGSPPGPEPCDGSGGTRANGALNAGVEIDRVSLAVGVTTTGDLGQVGPGVHMTAGFASARMVRIAKGLRMEASGSYSRATYLNMFGVSAGPGLTVLSDALDLSVYYRRTTLEYRSLPTSLVQQGAGGTVMLFPSSAVLFTMQSEAIFGDDAKALMVLGTVMWRPRF